MSDAKPRYGVGIVGYGLITRIMLPYLTGSDRFVIRAVVEPEEGRRSQAALDLPGIVTASAFEELGDDADLDVLIINTPAEQHYRLARAALDRNLHVLVAKPLALDAAEALDLAERATVAGRTVSAGHQLRYSSHYQAVEALVASGRLGSIEYAMLVNSKPRPEPANLGQMRHPALLEAACHHFDSLSAVLGGLEAQWVSCDGFNPSWSPYLANGMVNALVRYEGGLRLLYHGGFCAKAPMYELRLEGSDGVLRCRGFHMSDSRIEYEIAGADRQFVPIDLEDGLTTLDGNEAWGPFMVAWADYLDGGPEPGFSAGNNARILSLIMGAIESCETGLPVTLSHQPSGQELGELTGGQR